MVVLKEVTDKDFRRICERHGGKYEAGICTLPTSNGKLRLQIRKTDDGDKYYAEISSEEMFDRYDLSTHGYFMSCHITEDSPDKSRIVCRTMYLGKDPMGEPITDINGMFEVTLFDKTLYLLSTANTVGRFDLK